MEGMLEPGADRCMVYVLGALLDGHLGLWHDMMGLEM